MGQHSREEIRNENPQEVPTETNRNEECCDLVFVNGSDDCGEWLANGVL